MKFRSLVLPVTMLMLPVLSHAAAIPITTTDVTDQLAEINDAIVAVGTALLVAAGIAVAFKWAKAAVFG